jgi:hypothetical protein
MITTILQGGLGNQMFQYAMGLEQARRYDTTLRLDISALRYDSMRRFNLDLFAGVEEPTVLEPQTADIHEQGLPYNGALQQSITPRSTLKGYWQSERYFPNVAADLRQKFVPRDPLPEFFIPRLLEKVVAAGKLATFLGVRRTDYVKKQDFHGVLPEAYYTRAIQILTYRLGSAPIVFVFSDEPEWCKANLKLPVPFIVAGSYNWTTPHNRGREDADIYVMSKCSNAIIANSSFHWWGAWLGPQQNVIAPKQWFTTTAEDSSDIVPSRWIQI